MALCTSSDTMTFMKAMQGGDTVEDSYAQNSSFQNYSFHSASKPRLRQAIHHLISTTLRRRAASPRDANESLPDLDGAAAARTSGANTFPVRSHIAIADLGCSHGRNTLDCAHVVLSAFLDSCCYSTASQDASAFPMMEIQYFFSDLPSNDFNSLFGSLESYLQEALRTNCTDDQGQRPLPKILTAGVPGSFYGRLFPSASLDLVICSYGLHFLSQVPPSLLDKTSPAWNGGHIWISNTNPKEAVADAIAEQSQRDLKRFLKNRVQEVVSGGILFLILFAGNRENSKKPYSLVGTFEFCNSAWQELADEGVIAREEAEMFNLPMYFVGQEEIQRALKDVPEFEVWHVETVHKMPFSCEKGAEAAEQWVRFITSIMKPSLEGYVGEAKASEFFKKLRAVVSKRLDCFDSCITHDVDIVSLVRL